MLPRISQWLHTPDSHPSQLPLLGNMNSTMDSTQVESDHGITSRSGSTSMEVASSSSVYKSSRKNLGLYFMESDEGRRTPFAGGYITGGGGGGGGTTPVDIQRKPISEQRLSKTGGWLAAFFIFGISFIL